MVEERLLMMALLTFAAVPAYRVKTVLYVTTKKVCQDFWHTFLVINNRCFPAVLSVHFSRIFARAFCPLLLDSTETQTRLFTDPK